MRREAQRVVLGMMGLALCLFGAPVGAQDAAAKFDGPFLLVRDGKSAATIVTAAQRGTSVNRAVTELNYFLKRITGAALPVATDAQAVEGPVVLIGPSGALAKHGVDAGKLAYDNFLIRSGKDFLAIVGRDAEPAQGESGFTCMIGTANGVYAFLEDYCGVRVLMPGENGIVTPKTATLGVPDNISVTFQKSTLNGLVPFRGSSTEMRFRWRSLPGIRLKTYGGHSWAPAFPVKEYFDKHPEYYALVGGKRIKTEGSSLCVSNPDVLRLKIEWCKAQLKDDDVLEIGHPDSYGKSCPACECEKCRALGKTLGDRVYWFHKKVAEAIRAWDPSKKLLFLAYGPTYYPSADWKFPDNVIVEISSLSALESAPAGAVPWNKVHNQFSIYNYFWSPYFHGYGPANSVREVVDAFAKYKKYGVTINYYCTQPVNWGIEGPQYYLDYRLRMNYAADAQKALSEYYSGAYGPAAGAMREFFDVVEEAQNTPVQGANNSANRYLSRWPAERAEKALKVLDKAVADAGDDSVVKSRIELSQVGAQYALTNSRMFALERQYKKSGKIEDLEALAAVAAEREAWLDGILKKQADGYYRKLGIVEPFDGVYRGRPSLRDQVIYGKTDGSGLHGPFDLDFKTMLAFVRKHPKIEGVMVRAAAAPRIDGALDDAVWAKAPKMSMFKNDGSADAPVPMEIQLAYDQQAVYAAFTVHEPSMDKMEKQPAKVRRAESAYWEDSVEIFLGESGRDARKWVHTIVSFTNARYDGRFGFVNDDRDPLFSTPDHGWTAPWESAVQMYPDKNFWTVEVAIPWTTLGFGEPKAGSQLLANFTRNRWTGQPGPKPVSELYAWSPTFAGFEDSSRFGTVTLEP